MYALQHVWITLSTCSACLKPSKQKPDAVVYSHCSCPHTLKLLKKEQDCFLSTLLTFSFSSHPQLATPSNFSSSYEPSQLGLCHLLPSPCCFHGLLWTCNTTKCCSVNPFKSHYSIQQAPWIGCSIIGGIWLVWFGSTFPHITRFQPSPGIPLLSCTFGCLPCSNANISSRRTCLLSWLIGKH